MKCQLLISNILLLETSYSLAAGIFHFKDVSGREEDKSPFLTRYFHHSLGDFPLPQELHSFPFPQTLCFSVCSNEEELISYIGHTACLSNNTELNWLSEVSIQVLCLQTPGTFPEHRPDSGATESKTKSN